MPASTAVTAVPVASVAFHTQPWADPHPELRELCILCARKTLCDGDRRTANRNSPSSRQHRGLPITLLYMPKRTAGKAHTWCQQGGVEV